MYVNIYEKINKVGKERGDKTEEAIERDTNQMEASNVDFYDGNKIVRLFRENRILLKPGVVEKLKGLKKEELTHIIKNFKEKFVKNKEEKKEEIILFSEKDLEIILEEEKAVSKEESFKIPTFAEIKRPDDFHPVCKEYGHEIKIYPEKEITGKSKCKGELEDFVAYFNDRYKKLRGVLLSRPSKNRIVDIDSLSKLRGGEEARIIGIVNKKNQTKNGHLIIELEDMTGVTSVLVLNDTKSESPFLKAAHVVLDEVIGVDIKIGTNYNIVNDIVWPDLPLKNKKTIEKDVSIAFLSDIHVGSKFFCNYKFEKMLRWLNGMEKGKEIAEKIGYLLIAGDLIDGIGIYPKQERDLAVKDVYEQYKIFSKYIEMIPEWIKVVIIPGNHDAVRIAEPQPAIPSEMIKGNKNLFSLGNPAYLDVEKVKILMYHGGSLESILCSIPNQSFTRPDEAAIELLKKRTLSPLYDQNDIAPEHIDYLFIEEIDIFHTGHIHRNAYNEYRGTVVINAGAWIEQTDYQLKRGIVPTPCILPVYNLKDGRITHINFNNDEIKIV